MRRETCLAVGSRDFETNTCTHPSLSFICQCFELFIIWAEPRCCWLTPAIVSIKMPRVFPLRLKIDISNWKATYYNGCCPCPYWMAFYWSIELVVEPSNGQFSAASFRTKDVCKTEHRSGVLWWLLLHCIPLIYRLSARHNCKIFWMSLCVLPSLHAPFVRWCDVCCVLCCVAIICIAPMTRNHRSIISHDRSTAIESVRS